MGLKDCIIDLGVEIVRDKIHSKKEEREVRNHISTFIDYEYEKNFNVNWEEELNIQELFGYLQNNFIEEVKVRLTESNSSRRGEMHDLIIKKAVEYAKANTKLSEQRAIRIICDAMDILRKFYMKKANFELKFIASEVVTDVNSTIREESATIQKQIQESSFLSPSMVANNIRDGKLSDAARILSQSQSIINDEHCLKPYYGFSLLQKNGKPQLVSVPLIPEAETVYPPAISILSSEITVDNRRVEHLDYNVLQYSYNHQIPIKANVKEAIKYLGNIEDPSQYEAEELVGKLIEIKPKEFPLAFPCSLAIDDKVYFDYLLLRTKEILDDGTIVFDNREQEDRPFAVEFKFDIFSQSMKFNITVASDNHKNCLLYNEFAYNASKGGELVLKALGSNERFSYGQLKKTGDGDNYLNDLDILRKVIVLEEYFGTDIEIPPNFPLEDYDTLTWLSELITHGTSIQKWTGYTITFDLSKLGKDKILNAEDIPYTMEFVRPFEVNIFDFNRKLLVRRTLNDMRIKDLDKLKQKVEALDEDDPIVMKIIPNPNEEDSNDCIDELVEDLGF